MKPDTTRIELTLNHTGTSSSQIGTTWILRGLDIAFAHFDPSLHVANAREDSYLGTNVLLLGRSNWTCQILSSLR